MHRPTRLLALAILALAAAPRPADACGNEVERVVDVTNQSIRRAEALLADGAHQAAVKEVLRTFPKALRVDQHERRQSLFERGQRVLALAVVRSGGGVKLSADLPGKTVAQREAGLAWAAALLRLHHARGLGGVTTTAELAESLALRPAERREAHALLKDLADGDIVPTARAWAVLASLEKDRGDADAAARALARCKEIAADPTQCEVVPNA